jgi:hypothetical protein
VINHIKGAANKVIMRAVRVELVHSLHDLNFQRLCPQELGSTSPEFRQRIPVVRIAAIVLPAVFKRLASLRSASLPAGPFSGGVNRRAFARASATL